MWNVQGLRKKLKELEAYLSKFDIIALTETWMEEKEINKVATALNGYQWKWTPAIRRKERGRASGGQVYGIREGIEYKNFQSNNKGTLVSIDVKLSNRWIRIISVYNNTSIRDMEEELNFLCKGCEHVLMGGDWNARLGGRGAAEEVRSSRDSVVDEEGERWLELMAQNRLAILNGSTDGDWEGNFTRIGYDNQDSSVIDFVSASLSIRPIITRFEIGTQNQSDHFPTETTLSGKFTVKKTTARKIQTWGPSAKAIYQRRLWSSPSQRGWPATHKRMLTATQTKEASRGREDRSKWWTKECYEKRGLLRAALRDLRCGRCSVDVYRRAKVEYKREIKAAKEAQEEKLVAELQSVRTVADGWTFLQKLNKHSKVNQTQRPPDKEFTDHFKLLLQGEYQSESLHDPHTTVAPIITQEEFLVALAQLKEKKAEGPDGLKAEAIIHADVNTKLEIRRQMNDILQGGEIPSEWGESYIWPIYKKGDPRDPTNYRGIAIGNAVHKLLANIVRSRLQKLAEDRGFLPDTQNGFRTNRSTVDSIYIINACIQTTLAKPRGRLYGFFIDFKTAFDTVNRQLLWKTLEKLNVPEYLLVTLRNMYRDVHYKVGEDKFQSHVGLKQGCPLSPLLFTLFINGLDAALKSNQLGGVVLGRKKVHCLAFADDLVVLATEANDLRDMIKATQRFARNRQLTINEGKSKIIMFSKGGRASKVSSWKVEGSVYEEVEEFQYLGVTLQRNGRFTRHHKSTAIKVKRRAAEVWSLGERLFQDNYKVRSQMFESLVVPIALYAAEVTGYDGHSVYDTARRRHAKWILGLPQGTRTEIVDLESGGRSIESLAIIRAMRYEAAIPGKTSPLLKEAYRVLREADTEWRTSRARRAAECGWSEVRYNEDLLAGEMRLHEMERRVDFCEAWWRRKRGRLTKWYVPPVERVPRYLTSRNPQMRRIARYRCGAAFRGTQRWNEERSCRICGKYEESPEHLATHDPLGRDIVHLLGESGEGVSWMKRMDELIVNN